MRTPDFELTASEKEVLATIRMDSRSLPDHATETRNGDAVCRLMKSLLARGAIPAQRWKYFVDPVFNPGGHGRSRKGVFERNGCRGDEIFKHPHFLEFLQYFLFGANLPDGAIQAFHDQVRGYREINAKNIASVKRMTRNIARAYELERSQASEEFYKLALDCGLKEYYATDIRLAVGKKDRSSRQSSSSFASREA